jgi:hypothetical protein
VTRVTKILSFLALTVLASSFVYADSFSCIGANATVSTICGNTTLGLAGNRAAFDTGQAGYAQYDAIPWTLAADSDGYTPPCAGTFCLNPDFNSGDIGPSTYDNTGYAFGQSAIYNPDNSYDLQPPSNLSLYTTNSLNFTTGTGLSGDANTILSDGSYDSSSPACTGDVNSANQCPFDPGAAAGMLGFGLSFDTSTTGDSYSTGSNPVNGVYGVGFDYQLGMGDGAGGEEQATTYSVTFQIWAATPSCQSDINDYLNNDFETSSNETINCFNFQTGQPTNADGSAMSLGELTSALLATVTVNSSDGSAGFFSVTSSAPIGAIYESANSVTGAEGISAFGIDQVDLLNQQQTGTPEPATLLLFGSGLLFAARRLRKSVAK